MTWGAKGREVSEKASKSGLFVKLENKDDTIKVVFLAEPVDYIDTFEGGKATAKLIFEVWDVDMGCRRVLDINAKHALKWWDEIDEVGVEHQYRITRTGVSFDTAFDLRAMVRGELSPVLKGLIAGSEPIDVGAIISKKTKGVNKGPSAYDRDPVNEIPIDEAEAERLRIAEMDENLPVR